MNTITYSVPNIMCNHCVHTITTELTDLAGVESVSGEMEAKQITVVYDAPATLDKIEELLAEINYPVAK